MSYDNFEKKNDRIFSMNECHSGVVLKRISVFPVGPRSDQDLMWIIFSDVPWVNKIIYHSVRVTVVKPNMQRRGGQKKGRNKLKKKSNSYVFRVRNWKKIAITIFLRALYKKAIIMNLWNRKNSIPREKYSYLSTQAGGIMMPY